MFDKRLNLGISEFAVSRAIPELHTKFDYINARQIASHIGCERTTVYRAMKNLTMAGMLERLDGSPHRGGYRYRVK